ncbi:hypothetical protein EUTSA_v10025169mg [Eutrema salsugineum]|uniref:DUF4378 domain-containing protein n=1 Tax=Eutrema salsugineum TaxID=72664 RepID=V4LWN0_EUTSA|nr:uncharacterized protein LOC18028581 [Eutrema salsugineum]ESQ55040.1 hypothetical protein EUTSA_v10025169mg [Eutrema salsugineum]
MASISSSNNHLPMSKTRLKPLILRDYLLDDLSSCSSNGFKSFPRRQSSTVRRLLDAEIRRSRIFQNKRRIICGIAFTHAVHKASTTLLSAVKILPLPSSSVKSPSPSTKKGLLSRSFSRSFWKKLSRRELNNVDGEVEDDRELEIKRCKSFAEFLQESLDQPSDRISQVSPTDSKVSGEATLSNAAGGDSGSFGSELFTNSEATQLSSSGESETSNENDAVEDRGVVVMRSGDCVGSRVSDGSSVNDNREECVNEEKEQLSPISILECPFEDDEITPHHSHQNETEEKKLLRKSRRFEGLVRLEPVDLDKRIEQYVQRQRHVYDSHHMVEKEKDQSENQANRLFSRVKSRFIEEPNHLLASHKVDNLLLDYFKENGDNETRDDDKLVKIVEEWVMRTQEEEYMFMSWEVREKREIYVQEMRWGCINGDEIKYVVEELGNGFITFLIDELILDLSL